MSRNAGVPFLGDNLPVNMSEDGDLQCPVCGEPYLHHYFVESFFRDVEDEPTSKRNPSARRDGVRIRFYCENCHAGVGSEDGKPSTGIDLCIAQHKGFTVMFWDVGDR